METVLNTADFINEEDGQVRAAHKILGYTPIQKSFADPRHVISANHPRLSKITVVEQGFLISGGSPVPEGIPLVDLPPSLPALSKTRWNHLRRLARRGRFRSGILRGRGRVGEYGE